MATQDVEVSPLDQHEQEQEAAEASEVLMRRDGVATHEGTQQSYFGFEEIHKVFMPDGVSYIEHKTLNEGARRKYLNKVNRDIMLQRSTGNAIMRMQQGDEKHELLESAICGWNFVDADGQPVRYTADKRNQWLSTANPVHVDLVEKDVRKRNTWLMVDLSVEDIQKQIDELEEMKDAKIKEAEGNDS